MKKLILLCAIVFSSHTAFAASDEIPQRGVLAGMARLEGRGLSNALLFPVEWPHLAKQEFSGHPVRGIATFPFVVLTHLAGRLYSGVSDIVFMPLYYPFSRCEDSVPVGMGWSEYPWQ